MACEMPWIPAFVIDDASAPTATEPPPLRGERRRKGLANEASQGAFLRSSRPFIREEARPISREGTGPSPTTLKSACPGDGPGFEADFMHRGLLWPGSSNMPTTLL